MDVSLCMRIEQSAPTDSSDHNHKSAQSTISSQLNAGTAVKKKVDKRMMKTQNTGDNDDNNDDEPRDSDDYCWICHKPGEMIICSYCPRVYHPICLCMTQFPDIWLCPECEDVTVAECSLHQPKLWSDITQDQLKCMLFFLLDRLSRNCWAEHFREPVDTTVVEGYKEMIAYPMDLSTLYSRVKEGVYPSPQAFLEDFRWIPHNCIVFNGADSPLSSSVRLLDRTCCCELTLMLACPTCYFNRMAAIDVLPTTDIKLPPLTENEPISYLESVSRRTDVGCSTTDNRWISDSSSSKLDPWWFCKLCNVVHPLVWIRLQKFPRWPAKVIAHDGSRLLVSYFGDYDTNTAPIDSATLHSSDQCKRLSKLEASIHSANNGTNIAGDGDNRIGNYSKVSESFPSTSDSQTTKTLLTCVDDPTVKANYIRAVKELNYHLALIYKRYPQFKLPQSQVKYSRERAKKYYGPFSGILSASTSSLGVSSGSHQPPSTMERAVNTHKNNSNHKESMTIAKLYPTSNFYHEPVLARVAASLYNSPITSSTADHLIVTEGDPTDNKLKRKCPDVVKTMSPSLSSLASAVQCQSGVKFDDSSRCRKKKRKENSSYKPISSLVSISEAITATAVNDDDDGYDVTNKNMSTAYNAELPDYSPDEVNSHPFSLSNELRRIVDKLPSTSDTKNIVQMAFNDFRSLFYNALQKLEEKCDIIAESTSNRDIHLWSTPELPHLLPICSDVAVQTDENNVPYHNIDLDSTSPSSSCVDNSLKASKATECKTVQTDVVPTSSPSKFGHRPPTFQECLMEAEILRIEQENQRLNALLAYTRAEMTLEMHRRIAELRRVWSYELMTVVESAGRIWEEDVVQIVDAVKRCQWCAYCGRIAYYYCCWNTSYCNRVCQAKHWFVHMHLCVQTRDQVRNNSSCNRHTTSNGPSMRRYTDSLTSLSSSTATTDQCLRSSIQSSAQRQHPHPYNHHQQHQPTNQSQ
ncbi:unnamed protein product [Heterobilharzia americana]|nr:unnamed protein product [Heterobilharzia americana]